MTFQNAPWALDGALLASSLARRGQYAATNGTQGIVNSDDLKVSPLDTPGIGVSIAPGVGLVLNGYQGLVINETYVVSNPGDHIIPAEEMPISDPAARSFMVAVVVGDPEFAQAGHPWMLASDPPDGTEQTFQYVRPTLIQVAAGATELDVAYPALPLARIDIPANTTTITAAMIHDVRNLAQPRSDQRMLVSTGDPWNNNPSYIPTGSTYQNWGVAAFSPSVVIPPWARRCIARADVIGARVDDANQNINGGIRLEVGGINGPNTGFDLPISNTATRYDFATAGEFDVSAIAGTTVTAKITGYQGAPANPTTAQRLRLMHGSLMVIDLRFFEE